MRSFDRMCHEVSCFNNTFNDTFSIAPNKQEYVRPTVREHPMETNIPLIDEGQLDDTVLFPDLAINSMIEVTHGTKCYGVIRWIGGIPELSKSKELIAGIELVSGNP